MVSGDDRTTTDEFVLTGGYLVTMDPSTGDVPLGDLHIRDGMIVGVGPSVDAPGAERIDASGMLVLPGLVETHWHMWNTVLRGMSDGRDGARGYFATCAALAPWFTPSDAAAGVRLSCAEALDSGYTTVHDWSHNVRTPEHADAEIEALRGSGLRARFSYGYRNGHDPAAPMDLDDLARVHASWPSGGLVSLGVASRGAGGGNPAMRVDLGVAHTEFAAARELGLPVTTHASGSPATRGQIATLASAGLLGPDVQIVHATVSDDAERRALADAGCPVSLSPFTELQIGYGLPPTGELLAAGVPVGLSVDTTTLSGNADPFAIMKVLQAVQNGRAHDEFGLSARRTLELATIEGARSMGLDHLVGSLTVGKRADVIVVSAPGSPAFTDPARLLVTAVTPSDVDTVIVDGRIRKRAGRLTGPTVPEEARDARAALTAVLGRAGW